MIAPFVDAGIGGEFGLLLSAIGVGLCFGWFLERGGLGDAPKLAAQFYLRDLTVFKVMFSALLTAMLGAFWLDRFGLLDLERVYLPETFLAPQAAGGVLFGFGFILAGLCPGTSCTAAASGRIEGLVAMVGIFAGVFAFNALFPWTRSFYESTPLGPVTLAHWIGLPRGVVTGAITGVALVAFSLAPKLEGKFR